LNYRRTKILQRLNFSAIFSKGFVMSGQGAGN